MAGNTSKVTLAISGTAFPDGSTAHIVLHGGQTVQAAAVHQNGPTLLLATFDLTRAASGAADVVVDSPSSGSATLSARFTVQSGGGPTFWANISGPTTIRVGARVFLPGKLGE